MDHLLLSPKLVSARNTAVQGACLTILPLPLGILSANSASLALSFMITIL